MPAAIRFSSVSFRAFRGEGFCGFINLLPILLTATLLLGGCGGLLPRSRYSLPEVNLPQKWQGETVSGTTVASGEQWWRGFNDPTLDELVERALRSNNDQSAAAVRVRRAWLNSRLTDSNLTPSVTVGASAGINHGLKRGGETRSSSVTARASYELDLWGRLASARDASRWEAEATEADRQSVALALIGTTASDYWLIAFLNERIATTRASIAYAEKILELVEVKYQAGAVSALDRIQARQALASQRAELTQLRRRRTEARNALAILFDQAPENGVPERQQLPDGPLPEVAAGLPASLLARRPDLRAAEQRLRKFLANADATRASYYPALTLTGTLGGGSTSLLNLLQNPYAALGAGLTLPFIQWNSMKLNVEISKTDYEEAVVNFRQTLYSALGDVENALAGRTRYAEEGRQLEESLALAKRAEELAEVRYRLGSTALQAWLDTQESRRGAEKLLAENRLNRLNNALRLFQALGGRCGQALATKGGRFPVPQAQEMPFKPVAHPLVL